MKTLLAAIALSVMTFAGAHAGDAEKAVVERWYKALETIDRAAFADILADKAMITLEDLDIQQTKSEFIASLDEWQDAMRGSTMRHAIDSDADNTLTVTVCYKFPDNETLTREIFIVEAGKVTANTQATLSDSCAEFPG